ncbi:hypothetical protein ACNUDN_27910 [Mycobacterium sp. smrl_JER01]|uniref:hypothetical protein n=1 Tax=Mycobacterium sp. smrl_JER01 TaxID=3402633 RepID=UPI003AC582BD
MVSATEHQLAWDLADALNHHLTGEERTWVYVNLGSGHHRAAINRLLHIALRGEAALSPPTLDRLHGWCRNSHSEDEYAPMLSRLRKQPSALPPKPFHPGSLRRSVQK